MKNASLGLVSILSEKNCYVITVFKNIKKIKKKINNFNQVAMSLFKTIVVSSVCIKKKNSYKKKKKNSSIQSVLQSCFLYLFFFSVVPSNDFSICHDIY